LLYELHDNINILFIARHVRLIKILIASVTGVLSAKTYSSITKVSFESTIRYAHPSHVNPRTAGNA